MATIDPEEPLAVAVVEAIHTGDLRRCSGYWPSIPDWPPLGWAMTALPGCPARYCMS